MHVLLSAYACRPNSGSEEGNGWGWATHLAARGLRVHVLTIARDQLAIEAEQQRHLIPNLSFSFVEPALKGLKWGHGLHYLAWQFAVVDRAKKLLAANTFDLVHHVTYGSIHVPSQLWRLGIPVVFGPVGGGQTSPFSMRHYFGEHQQKELLRTALTKSLRFSPLHRRWIKRMAVVFATNEETLTLMKQLGRKDAVLSLDVCVPQTFLANDPKIFQEHESPLRLLWTGRMMPRKALALTLDAVAKALENVTLTIVGDGIAPEVVRQMIVSRGLESKVFWKGDRVPWSEMRAVYREHDAFLFTSLRDSCGGQLLEALALGLPVITLDHHGARLLIPDDAGYKVPVTEKEPTISAIAAAIDAFASASIQQKNAMSAAGLAAARNLTFGVRAERAEHLYERILAAHRVNKSASPGAGQIEITDVTPI
jgi:glycosyltransferase involved in cell wall biosynthesis